MHRGLTQNLNSDNFSIKLIETQLLQVENLNDGRFGLVCRTSGLETDPRGNLTPGCLGKPKQTE